MLKRGWYHSASLDGFMGIMYFNELPEYDSHFSFGPFKTFGEAKRDAIDYYRTDITTAREHIRQVLECKRWGKK